jgi:hypothetical protein
LDAANLDFAQLQDLISQQMAEIESTWEAPLGGEDRMREDDGEPPRRGGTRPAAGFSRVDGPTGVARNDVRARMDALIEGPSIRDELPPSMQGPPLHLVDDDLEPPARPAMPSVPSAAPRGVFSTQVADEAGWESPDFDAAAASEAAAASRLSPQVEVRHERVDRGLADRRGAYRPKHTYSGRSGGESVASSLALKYAAPPDERTRLRRLDDEGGAGQGTPRRAPSRSSGDRYAYRRARRAEDTMQME